MPLETPVALFLFNRPQLTERVFTEIARQRPRRLFLIADGPRHQADRELCDAARHAVCNIDWPCEVYRHFSDFNLGCRRRMASGIDFVFDHVDEAILLEDDCLPDRTFFPFCSELLDRYRDEPRIAMISGDNFQRRRRRTDCSYYFSQIPHVWGWATWVRSWRHYDVTIRRWPQLRQTDWLEAFLGDAALAAQFTRLFDDAYDGRIDTWDYQWAFSIWSRAALTVLPEVNLVTNLGFGPGATHTKSASSADAAVPLEAMRFPLRHPRSIECCTAADRFTFEHSFGIQPEQPLAPAA